MTELIAKRLKYAREKLGLTQAQLSQKLGFKDRQTVAAIEAGQRKLSAEELVRAMQVLGVDVDYFTDPLRLVGEGRFNWRVRKDSDPSFLQAFEDKAGRWIATYRYFCKRETASALKPRLPLTEQSTYEEARTAAEALGREWDLGEIPALHLETRLRERIGTLVLYVEAPDAVSGAACLLPEISTILINRREPEGRRHYDLAHEVFHLLTWEQMPPEHYEGEIPRGGKGRRVEQLADNFASALLMPERTLAPRWQARGQDDIHNWLNATATELLVTAVALKWRLVQLGWLAKADLHDIHDIRLVANGRPRSEQPVPKLFSVEFIQCLHDAVLRGAISVRRSASLLDMTLHDLADLFQAYGYPVPFDL
ncbi:MAG TPA: XRE family transcriptional regulator [Nitrospiraceae bacterium]|jgi:Zn-dependent peptidase ImmA (M78 family)/DNA-binding XRE family transcriptional regulator|nr:XRE family transcriptional regulator [Nitrospiraceae bacterium]